MVGNWKGTQDTPDGKEDVTVEYNLSSAGTILTEKLMPGTPHEMFSIYHGDTNRVLMTHYCAFGNQPRMKMVKTNRPNTYKFVYMDGTSIRSIKDPHMHQLTLTMLNKNHITHEWVFYENGKPAQTVTFNLKRVK